MKLGTTDQVVPPPIASHHNRTYKDWNVHKSLSSQLPGEWCSLFSEQPDEHYSPCAERYFHVQTGQQIWSWPCHDDRRVPCFLGRAGTLHSTYWMEELSQHLPQSQLAVGLIPQAPGCCYSHFLLMTGGLSSGQGPLTRTTRTPELAHQIRIHTVLCVTALTMVPLGYTVWACLIKCTCTHTQILEFLGMLIK